MIIDVDSHWWEPFSWLLDTDPSLQAELDERLPPGSFAEVVFGEVLAELPEDQQREFVDLFAHTRFLSGGAGAGLGPREMDARVADSPFGALLLQPGSRRADERVAWCDERGIDVQLISPTLALGTLQRTRRHAPDLLGRLAGAYNTWTTDTVGASAGRLVPVGILPFHDVGWAVDELVRLHGRGSRAFLVPMYPVEGRSLAHRTFDPIWATATDLGMVPVLHVASGSVVFDPGWCSLGGDDDAAVAFRLASSLNAQIPQLPLSSMVLGGLFDRHPDLQVLCSEFGLSWVPGWLDKLGPVSLDGTPNISALLPWTLERSAHDYVRDHVRFSPLKGQRIGPLLDLLGPQSVCFASDYPHPEGSSVAVDEVGAELEARPEAERSAVMGGTAARLLGLAA